MTSIRGALLCWLNGGLLLCCLAAAVAVYSLVENEVGELNDYQLRLVAEAISSNPLDVVKNDASKRTEFDIDDDDQFIIQTWDPDGTQTYSSVPALGLRLDRQSGYETVATASGPWRIYSVLMRGRYIQVGLQLRARNQLAVRIALRAIVPLLILFPLVSALVWIVVHRGLRPLTQVMRSLKERSVTALQPLPTGGLKAELLPLVLALNDLLERLARAITVQRNFVADAAHQLRTPLAAVRLQMQLAQRAQSSDERISAFNDLANGVNRAVRLVEQLLTLAKHEPDGIQYRMLPLDLAGVVTSVVNECSPLVREKAIDLQVRADEPVGIMGDLDALRVMLQNLVENAIRYTPSFGQVEVRVDGGDRHACVEIADTGPGVPEAERERVFDRFFRRQGTQQTGSGLGLAIVRNIASRHGAVVRLLTAAGGSGLLIRVEFPESAA
ncbi:MAG: two-component sensor histidine kinase [Proteobacteria bacterium]|uniref:sensor histidine kinase n=1 Tax=Rudaea sp. TaxID=2136325 RepID=UPI001D6C3EB6|nr:two-component sensor histidine kinase [Pseudomonadota bacterium]MBS0568008.1 two-component sensor histidine kinase [Pseudomonadota bacterium]